MINEWKRTGLPTIQRFGFWTAVLSAVFYLGFDVACALGLSGLLTDPFWVSLTWYGPSLLLAYSYLGMAVAVHHDPENRHSLWSFCAVVLAVIYATLNSFVYTIQVFILAPSYLSGTSAAVSLMEMASGKPLFAVNGWAYTLMGVSTLFLSLALAGSPGAKNARALLFVHGVTAPFVLGALLVKELFLLSSTVALTYPAAALLVAQHFRRPRNEG